MFENLIPHSTQTKVPRERLCLVCTFAASSEATVQLMCMTEESSSFGAVPTEEMLLPVAEDGDEKDGGF